MSADDQTPGAEAAAEAVQEEKAEDAELKAEGQEHAAEKAETEADAPADDRQKVAPGAVCINASDSTMNVVSSADTSMVMALTDGGWQYLIAGARSTAGVKAGRYLFEVRIVETLLRPEASRALPQRQLCRLGLTSASTSLFLGEADSESACFDCEGYYITAASRRKVCPKYGREVVLGLLVNLDASSPNANTVSLFANGARSCDPQPIPEHLLGKPLFPTVTFRNVSLQVNFGSAPMAPLPFTCTMLSEAAAADVELAPRPGGDGFQVVFPVGLPEQGYFDWVDAFLERHPDYVELSDRKLLEWCARSGLTRSKTPTNSVDKPDMKFSVPGMDDAVIRRLLTHLATTANRNFVVPELKGNLLAAARQSMVKKFGMPKFKKVAMVVVGEPTAEFKARTQELIVKDKKAHIESERKSKKAAAERLKVMQDRKKKAMEMLRKRNEGGAGDEAKEEEEPAKDGSLEEEEIVVEVTDEEKTLWYRKTTVPEVHDIHIAKCYSDFSLPSVDEGFDEVRYEWQQEAAAATALKDWQFARKLTQRVDDLKPGEWFTTESAAWAKKLQEWRKAQAEWKDPKRRAALKEKKAEARKKAAEEAKEKGLELEAEAEAEADAAMEIDPDTVDVMSVEDVADLGSGEPLFSSFSHEDWALLAIRYELFLLVHSFKKDLDDADRPSFSGKDLCFYYQKYFKKQFGLRNFNVDSIEGLAGLIKDTLAVDSKTGFLQVLLPEDTPAAKFLKLAELHRRDRQRRLDAGDESAELKFPRTFAATSPAGLKAAGGHQPQPPAARPGALRPQMPGTQPPRPQGPGLKRPAAPPSTQWVAKQPRTGGMFFKR